MGIIYLKNTAKTIFCAIAILAFALLILFWGVQIGSGLGRFGAERHYHSSQYAADTKERIEKCRFEGTSGSAGASECVSTAIDDSREHQRAEDDLNAQKDMAWWAQNMFYISAIQLPISIFGIYALIQTINQSRAAITRADEANKIAVGAQRPWLKIDLIGFSGHTSEINLRLDLFAEIKNTGKSNANITSYGYRYCAITEMFNSNNSEIAKIPFGNYSGVDHKSVSMPDSEHSENIYVNIDWVDNSVVGYYGLLRPHVGALVLLEVELKYGWDRTDDAFLTRWRFLIGANHPTHPVALLHYRVGEDAQHLKVLSLGCTGAN
jgi:hypothetical protein